MKRMTGLGQYKSVDSFVKDKLAVFDVANKDFAALFELMFREKENVMYEYSSGYRIIKKTYAEVYDELLRRAETLRLRLSDLPAGSVVGLYMDNSLLWIELFWAILLCGYEPLLLNLRVSDELLARAIADGGVRAVVSDGRDFAPLPTLCASEIAPADAPLQRITPGQFVWVMSSGTSMSLKLCAYGAEEFYYQICGSMEIIRRCRAIKSHCDGELKLLTFLPFYHVFGLIAVYIWFAFFSRTFVQLNDMAPRTILNTVKRHKVTHIFAVPLLWQTAYEQTMKTVRGRGEKTMKKFRRGLAVAEALHDVPFLGPLFSRVAFREVRAGLFGKSIRFLITGGSGISRQTLAFFNAVGYRLANGYGMTEIGITSLELSRRKKYLLEGYVGSPITNVEYRLNEDGELLVRGRATARIIVENGVRSVRAQDDWYDTHDLAEEKDGHYRILARRDDVIVTTNGENVNPFFLEPAFTMPHVRGACLIRSRTDDRVTPVLLVSVERFLGREALAVLRERVDAVAVLHGFPHDGRIVLITDPLLAEGEFKINRRRLADDYDSGRLHTAQAGNTGTGETVDDPLFRELRLLYAMALERDEQNVGTETDFFLEENGTSLAWFALEAQIRDEIGVDVGGRNLRSLMQLYHFVKEEKNRVDTAV